MLVVGALVATSCKGEKKDVTDAVNATTEAVTTTAGDVAKEVKDGVESTVEGVKTAVTDKVASALEGVSIPSFSNAALTENLTSYAAYAKDYVAADGNLGKISAMASKGAALLAKGKELAAGLGADEMKKYTSVLSAIQAKMAPAK